jgi:hypothetical protein
MSHFPQTSNSFANIQHDSTTIIISYSLKKHHHYIKRATAFFARAIILLSLVTFNQSPSSLIAYGDDELTDRRMTDVPMSIPFGAGIASTP